MLRCVKHIVEHRRTVGELLPYYAEGLGTGRLKMYFSDFGMLAKRSVEMPKFFASTLVGVRAMNSVISSVSFSEKFPS
jgi:hypothetical protein